MQMRVENYETVSETESDSVYDAIKNLLDIVSLDDSNETLEGSLVI